MKLKEKLKKSRQTFKQALDNMLLNGKDREEILEGLTETLLLSDVGMETTEKIINSLRTKSGKNADLPELKEALEKELVKILSQYSPKTKDRNSGSVFMFVGVNGGGKTTTLAKLAYSFKKNGKEILMVAADTFRAAAQEQLIHWGKKLNIPVIKGQYGADPASVVYDAIQSFKARKADILLIDTAGRIHTKVTLMNELEKIRRIVAREIENAPHEIYLVLDASTGRNALFQAREFLKFSGLTGIILTKLDGTAKGGSVISIADELKLPVSYIGIGEREADLFPFSAQEFIKALLS